MLGASDSAKPALSLRRVLAERGLAFTHPLDLLTAFRADVTKRRYANWDELMNYCRYSAMPVGRFVLDLHGEDQSTWTYSDPLCSALQVINHLQDCAKDYCELDRVYLPLDMMAAHGTSVSAPLNHALHLLCKPASARSPPRPPPSCRRRRNCHLPCVMLVSAWRQGPSSDFAHKLIAILLLRDPLSETVHLSKPGAALQWARGAAATIVARLAGQHQGASKRQ